jgi:uncharacterized protein with von Willebrand factor type A (vWA) domain
VIEQVVAFGALLRAHGIRADTSRVATAVSALAAIGPGDRDALYFALRCTLVSRAADLRLFDELFAGHWGAPPAPQSAAPGPPTAIVRDVGAGGEDGPPGAETVDAGVRASAVERLATVDFATYGPDDSRRADAVIQRLATSLPHRRAARTASARRGDSLDVRTTLRRAARTGGEPLQRAWRAPVAVPRRLVFLVDVSGSMRAYARPMMVFAHAVVRSGHPVEVFTFGTRLTRLTPHLRAGSLERALTVAGEAVPDWGGGTRIGESMRAFNDEWARAGMTRGAVVVVVSDGWERGDPGLLGVQMARLARASHSIVWVNHLAGDDRFTPEAGGMAAAAPWVTHLVAGDTLSALTRLAGILKKSGPARRPAPREAAWSPA